MSRYRGSPPTTLYVRNISDRVRYDDVKRLFTKYGKVIDVTIPLDYYSGLPKGYAFIEFEDPRDAEEAQYRMDRQRLFGREIEVEFARGDRKTPGEMRTRDRDRRYPPRSGGGGGGGGGRMDDYERDNRRSRSRSRGYERRAERRGGASGGGGGGGAAGRSRSREASYSRSKSRGRSYSKNRTPSPRTNGKPVSRERSRSPRDRSDSRVRGSPRRKDRSDSRQRDSPRRVDSRSPKMMNSRSPSPA